MTELHNQTQFTFEEPLFEAPPSLPSEPDKPTPPWYKKPQIIIPVVAGGVLLLVLIMAIILRPKQAGPDGQLILEPTPSPTTLSPIEQRINQLKTELQAADPSKQDLPFPPVDMELQLASPAPAGNN